MDKSMILSRVRGYLAGQLGCPEAALSGDGLCFCAHDPAAPDPAPFLQIVTMGRGVVVSASQRLLPRVRAHLEGRSREEIFEYPWVYGLSLYYIPDFKVLRPLPLPGGLTFELSEGPAIGALRGIQGFDNSLAFDAAGQTPTCIAFYARQGGRIVGLAGAAPLSGDIWEMGVDVLPECRTGGLASVLVSRLAAAILQRGIAPVYCAASSNLGSQAVAHRSGLMPCWISTYRNILDGSSAYEPLVGALR